MSDDHTSQAIASYNSRLKPYVVSKNIDRIAEEGALLKNCFCTNSICTPSRACVLTGLHSHVSGVTTLKDHLDPQIPTSATLLQEAGYQTAIIGKWHLHSQPQGFDRYMVLGGNGQGTYQDPSFKDSRDPWEAPERKIEGYSADIITDHSLEWLKGLDPDKPFSLMCHFKATHEPFWPPERNFDLFEDVEFPEPEDLFWPESPKDSVGYSWPLETLGKRFLNKPNQYPPPQLKANPEDPVAFRKATYQKFIRDYLRTGAAIDENVGRLLDYLDQSGLAENTIVVYTSDQGYFLGEHNLFDKRFMLEESLRMPFLIRYPKEIRKGTVTKDIVTNVDFAQTFLDYAGVAASESMQGRSFRSNLAGTPPEDWQESMYYHYWEHSKQRPSHEGVRRANHKLINFYGLIREGRHPDDCWEFYDLEKDPFERNNRIDVQECSQLVDEMKEELKQLKKKFVIPHYRPNCKTNPFSLVELLVVISILAVLISLLIPSLRRSHFIARNLSCMTIQKSLNVATHVYAEDHGGSYPTPERRGAAYDFTDIPLNPYLGESNEEQMDRRNDPNLICPQGEDEKSSRTAAYYSLFFNLNLHASCPDTDRLMRLGDTWKTGWRQDVWIGDAEYNILSSDITLNNNNYNRTNHFYGGLKVFENGNVASPIYWYNRTGLPTINYTFTDGSALSLSVDTPNWKPFFRDAYSGSKPDVVPRDFSDF